MKFKKQFRTILLVFLSLGLLSFFGVPNVSRVHAQQGQASLYILTLGILGYAHGAGGTVSRVDQLVNGAQDAATPENQQYDLPQVHPKFGTIPPYFYGASVTFISYYDTLKSIVENNVGAVIFNPLGDYLPVPCGYTDTTWISKIAEAMTQRRLTWINVGGYPFYYTFQDQSCGGATTTPGVTGIQTLLNPVLGSAASSISLDVPSGLSPGGLTTFASNGLSNNGWRNIGTYAASAAPATAVLKKNDFKDIVVFPIYSSGYGCPSACTEAWEGAVIGFTAASTRSLTSHGAGSLVFMTTNQFYDQSGKQTQAPGCSTIALCNDYFHAYVAVAAALLVESTQFTPNAHTSSDSTHDVSLKVNPVILGYSTSTPNGPVTVRLAFGLYGGVKTTDPNGYITDVHTILLNVDQTNVQLQAQLGLSRNGNNAGGIQVQNLASSDETFMTGVDTALFLGGLWPVTAPFANFVGGWMLFQKWSNTVNNPEGGTSSSGVTSPGPAVDFFYQPQLSLVQSGSTNVYEFQSIVIVDVQIAQNSSFGWLVVPIDYDFHVNTESLNTVDTSGKTTLAVWMGSGAQQTTIFQDDFGQGVGAWTTSENGASNNNWGVITSPDIVAYPNVAYPSAIGTNTVVGGQSVTAACAAPGGGALSAFPPCYDKNMDASMTLDLTHLNLQAYQSNSIQLTYRIYTGIRIGDYLTLDFGQGVVRTYSGDDTIHFYHNEPAITIPNSAQTLRFRFVSNGDNNVWYGPLIDDVLIVGNVGNDANTGGFAGNSFQTATTIPAGTQSSPATYSAYLPATGGQLEDWYQFSASAGGTIAASISSLSIGQNLQLQLFDPSDATCSGCSGSSVTHTAGTTGNWRLKVFSPSGNNLVSGAPSSYGSYQFSLQSYLPPDFTISASPSSQTLPVGAVGTSSVAITSIGGFSGKVNLALTPVQNLACNPSSAAVSGGAGTASFSCSSSVPATYTVTVTGTSGQLSHSTTFSLQVQGSFQLSASPASVSTIAGQPGSVPTITVSAGSGFSGIVNMTASITPSTGITCSLSPSYIRVSGTSSLICYGSVGTYLVTVIGQSGPAVAYTTVSYTVSDFTMSVNPTSLVIPTNTGKGGAYVIISEPGSPYPQNLALSVTTSSSSLTASLNPTSTNAPGASWLSLSSTTPGPYTVTVTASAQGLAQHTASVSVTVQSPTPAPSFNYFPSYPLVGQAVNFTATTGSSPPYTYSWNFGDGTTGGSGQSILHSFIVHGTYTVTMSQTDSGGHILTSSQLVTASPIALTASFSSSPSSPASVGQVVSFTASFSGGESPYSLAWNFGDGTTATGISATHAYSNPGLYSVVLSTTDSGGHTFTDTQNMLVGDYLSYASPSPLYVGVGIGVTQGGSTSTTIVQKSIYGFSGTVSLQASISPTVANGPTISFPTTSVSIGPNVLGTATLSVSAGSTTPFGTYTIRISSASGTFTHPVTIILKVLPSPIVFGATETYSGVTATISSSFTYDGPSNSLIGTTTISATNTTSGVTIVSNRSVSMTLPFSSSGIAMFVLSVATSPYWLSVDCRIQASNGVSGCTMMRSLDLDHDGTTVNIVDLSVASAAYDTKIGDPKYNPVADVNGDGKVDISDLSTLAYWYQANEFLP